MSRYTVERGGRHNRVPGDTHINWRNLRAQARLDHSEGQPAKAFRG